jgi:hypothetical protein
LVTDKIGRLNEAEEPTKLFEVKVLTELRNTLTASNVRQFLTVQKLEQEDRLRELKVEAIIRGAFGRPFHEECAGALGTMYETADVRQVVHVFVTSKLTYMDDSTKMRVKERIANLDGKRRVV